MYTHHIIMKCVNKPRVTISLDGDVLENVDRNRGLIPRSAYINAYLKNISACVHSPGKPT